MLVFSSCAWPSESCLSACCVIEYYLETGMAPTWSESALCDMVEQRTCDMHLCPLYVLSISIFPSTNMSLALPLHVHTPSLAAQLLA